MFSFSAAMFVYFVLFIFQTVDAVKLSSSDVIVRCHDNKMVVTIEREKLEDKNNNVFAFSDANCQAESNKTHFVATAAFDRCGTVTHKEKNGVKHKNILREITPKTNDKKLPRNHTKHYCPFMDVYVSCWIPLKSRVRVPRNIITTTSAEKVVTCREKIGVGPQIDDGILKRARLSSINSISTKLETIACPMLIGIGEELEPDRVLTYTKLISTEKVTIKRKMVNCKPLERTSKFNIQMSIYSDATYTELLLLQEKAKRSDRYDDVYYEISIKDHLNLNIVPTTCYATPYPDPSTKMKYTFVKDGCSLDETYKLYPSFNGKVRFSITSFKFLQSASETFYVHCSVVVCEKESGGKTCNVGCNDKRARRKIRATNFSTDKIVREKGLSVKAKVDRGKMVNRVGVHISKQQRYLIFKKMGSLMLLMNIKLSKAQVREYHSSPVTMAIETTIQRWRIKLQLSEKSQKLNSLIQLHCTYGPSRISRRQKLVIANGCSKEDAWRVDVNPYDNTVTINSEIFSHARENNKPYFMTCAVSVCSKHDPMCMTEYCNEKAPRRTIRSLSSSGSRTQLTCHSNSITLTVRKPLPGNIPADSLHLRDPECKANENSTHVTITTKVNQCGTKLTRKTYYVEYSNVLLEKLPETLIIRRDLVQIPFRCTYSQSPLARALSIKYETQSVKFRSHAFGSYSVNIGLYSDSNYTKTNTESLVDIDSDRDMYFEVKITSPQLNLALFLDKCFGAPLHRTTQSEEYAFIENGCALDDTLKFYKTDDFSKIQFSIKPFTFTDNSSNVVINCYVTACNAQESNTKCRKGCQDNNNQS